MTLFRRPFPIVVFAALFLTALGGYALISRADAIVPSAASTVNYAKDVQPILSARCYECHGPAKSKGGFRADSRASAFHAGDSGEKPIVPHDVKKSHLLALVRGDKPDQVMPPKGERLTAQQIDVLTRWIEQGASWPDTADGEKPKSAHWAFNKPVKRDPPAVKDAGWVRNPIDNFVLAAQEKQGLHPSPEADKYSLIRRASLDLTGLPPTQHDIGVFLADTASDAYERLIDRLLANPHYGERWARVWLDVARYADSSGYGSDPLRFTAWPYRDWIIQAFNRNLSYDRFTIEQIAGDLLPNATRDQIIATGFHRNTMTNTEGGTDDEEWRIAAVKDRTAVTVQAWMGLTMGCCECHSHKYDPITQREYYQLFAVFNQTEDNDQPTESPTIPVPTSEQDGKTNYIKAEIAKVQAAIDDPAKLAPKLAAWEKKVREADAGWKVLEPKTFTSKSGATLAKQSDNSILAGGTRGATDVYTITATTELKDVTAFRLEALPEASLPNKGPGRGDDGNFVLNDFKVGLQPAGQIEGKVRGRFIRISLSGVNKIIHLAEVQAFAGSENVATKGVASQSSTSYDAPAQRAIDGNTDGVFDNKSVTHTAEQADPFWEVDLKESRDLTKLVIWPRVDSALLFGRLDGARVSILADDRKPVWSTVIDKGPDKALEIVPGGASVVALKDASASFSQAASDFNVTKAIDADTSANSGWAVGANFGKASVAVFQTAADGVGATQAGPATITFTLTQNFPNLSLGRFRISATTHKRPVRELPSDVAQIITIAPAKRSAEQMTKVADYFKSIAPHLAPQRKKLAKLNKELADIKPPQVAIMRDLPKERQRKTYVLVKGNWMSHGDEVQPGVPAAFNAMPSGAQANRLGVAEWLVDKENPLTARVAVNRFWAALFGTGIVLTQEDFGTMGQPPTNPELLDWLAVTFRDDLKWDVKALLKTIMTSGTYRQSSKQTPELLAKDPTNKLLTRAPRLRLEAEAVRDQALALSGLLSQKMFGPSVYPPQPAGMWQAAFNGERTYPTSTGEDKYRRGVYTFWRRTVPYPSMAAFDAPSREQCTLRRIPTSTPIQAFVTLNDPVYVECAQALARRIVKEGGASPDDRAAWALKHCLARPATPEQSKQLVELYNGEATHYRTDMAAANAMATEPLGPLPAGADAADLAAWTVVSNVLLNLDGVLTKG
jgi:mono/diheme cytochrome c family protein